MSLLKYRNLILRHFIFFAVVLASLNTFGQAKCDILLRSVFVNRLSTEAIKQDYDSSNIMARKTRKYDDKENLDLALMYFSNHAEELTRLAHKLGPQITTIGIGGSPSPIIAIMQKKWGREIAFNLPISIPKIEDQGERSLNSEQIEEVFQVWENFLPPAEKIKNKKLQVLDFAVSGDSLFFSADLIQAYYKRQGHDIEVRTISFSEPHRGEDINEVAVKYFKHHPHTSYELSRQLSMIFINSGFKPLSEYPSFVPLVTNPATLKSREPYLKWVESLAIDN